MFEYKVGVVSVTHDNRTNDYNFTLNFKFTLLDRSRFVTFKKITKNKSLNSYSH